MKTIKVKIYENASQVSGVGSITNFSVSPVDYDQGLAIGYGSTVKKAVDEFIESWYMKYEEDIQVEITKTEIV